VLRSGIKVGVHEVKIDVDKIKELAKQGGDIYSELSIRTTTLATGYRVGNVQVLDLLRKIRAIHKLYNALGAYEGKLKFHEDVSILLKIYNGIMHSTKKPRLPESFWHELYKLVHEKTQIPDIALIESITIDADELEKVLAELQAIPPGSARAVYASAEAILGFHSILEQEPLNPVYKEIHERLKKLEEEWSNRREVSETWIKEIADLYEKFSRYKKARDSMDLAQRLIYDTKSYLSERFSLKIVNLENTETTICSLVEKYRYLGKTIFYEEDEKKLRLAILKDLFKLLSGITDNDTIKSVRNELANHIRDEIIQQS
jgi:hypothetical protein